eukprot:gnl/Spiro4/23009_TR11362_c0_g1_i1.p1 gnl/Spiro4/23009_TR11362_c0_g1~~gnl/Spiro4/23009_TR11362_c0_g1_i1.p1  ORF type:complete len:391 (-),score=52.17 gnl/Spiro4/23009_TR11362_c0_g1_i1:130-1302(-)
MAEYDLTQVLRDGLTAFSLHLFAEIVVSEGPRDNVVVCPFVVHSALSTLLVGCQPDTRPSEELLRLLRFSTVSQPCEPYEGMLEALRSTQNVHFLLGTGFASRIPLSPIFHDLARRFGARCGIQLNRASLNAFAAEATNGQINNVYIEDFKPDAKLAVVTAVFFKGNWGLRFPRERTLSAPFRLLGGSTVPCRLMQLETDSLRCCVHPFEGLGPTSVVVFPLGADGFLSMVLMLPPEGVTPNPLCQLLARPNAWITMLNRCQGGRRVQLALPRFRIEYGCRELDDDLHGVGSLFHNAHALDRIAATPQSLLVNSFLHKTAIVVDEDGEDYLAPPLAPSGAAPPAANKNASATPQPPFVMRIDRPFVFVVMETWSCTPLLCGRVLSPPMLP